jgi:hypothetical protein
LLPQAAGALHAADDVGALAVVRSHHTDLGGGKGGDGEMLRWNRVGGGGASTRPGARKNSRGGTGEGGKGTGDGGY